MGSFKRRVGKPQKHTKKNSTFFKKGIDKAIDKCYNKHIKKSKFQIIFYLLSGAVCGLPSFFCSARRRRAAFGRIFRIVRQFRFFRGNRTIRLGGSNSRNCLNCLTILKIKTIQNFQNILKIKNSLKILKIKNSLNFQKIQTL